MIAYGLLLRAWNLGDKPFRVDEAESSINALTIIEHGVPVDQYLGLPLYENALTRPWPESAEYEFKDTSYSDRGLAVYHGWLPLYAIAGSFALSGVKAAQDPTALRVQYSVSEIHRRTVAGRIPALGFGAVFLVAVFFAGRELYGRDAAWAALAAAVVAEPAIYFARQARYYSATIALVACCALLICRIVMQGRWRDFLLAAIVLAFLFHTHMLSFFTACTVLILTAPWLARHQWIGAKLGSLAAIVLVATVPWVLLTGFLGSAGSSPKGRSLLSFEDLVAFMHMLGPFPLLAAVSLGWLLVAGAFRGSLPSRLVRPFADHTWVFFVLAVWALLGLVAFVIFMPAVSYFYGRLVLTIFVPCLLFGAVLFAAASRMLTRRYAPVLAPCLFLLALAQAGQASFWGSADPGTPFTFDVIERLHHIEIRPGTRLYATPNYHLTLTFYTGLPFQNVAPVRKSFLDRYQGELLIVEAGPRYEPLSRQEIQRVLLAVGRQVDEAETRALEQKLATRLLREELRPRVRQVTPALEPAPEHCEALFLAQRLKTIEAVARSVRNLGNPMFQGYVLLDYLTCWQTFFYRFVDPQARTGPHLNYADRIRNAHAIVLPQEWVIYQCPASPSGRNSP